ncbi:MAG TPA: hypothetical protein VLY85_01430, partial [Thermoplasmata archaeon]|nr:hypothetical protein [Thermoplasmata archaeon]
GLAYHASSELEAMRWGGHWLAQAGTGPERQHRVVPLVAAEVERLRRREVPRGTLDAIRESAIGEIPLGLESTSGAHELAVDVAYHELPDDFYRTWPGRLRALTAREVRAAAEIAFDAATSCTIVAGPGSTRTVGRKA